MAKLLKPGQLCTIKGKVYRCSKRTSDPCLECLAYYGGRWGDTPCEDWIWMDDTLFPTCGTIFGHHINDSSFPILVSMCKNDNRVQKQ